ncbi:MAG: ABC transporter ATP-binding protein [Spirochaetes bacterium]|nr:ABC transporter ATP-binding protein [Spirochaetota bacterium]
MVLEINNITVHYGAIRAIDDISIAVEKGKIVSVIGANGAGKSTTLRAISGIVPPTSGTIKLNGKEITKVPPHLISRNGIAHVPEGRGIFGNLTVKENLELATLCRSDKVNFSQEFEHVFNFFPRLKERFKQVAGTLSGGEQQMLAVSRALMQKGQIMLLDEPSMGLAPNLVEEIFNIIKMINEEGTTILLVEQNAFKAISISDYSYVLETGSIVLEGPSEELKTNEKVKEAYLGG